MPASIERVNITLAYEPSNGHSFNSSYWADLWSRLYVFLTKEAQPVRVERVDIERGIVADMSVVGCDVSLSSEEVLRIRIGCNDMKLALVLTKKIQGFLESYEYKPVQPQSS